MSLKAIGKSLFESNNQNANIPNMITITSSSSNLSSPPPPVSCGNNFTTSTNASTMPNSDSQTNSSRSRDHDSGKPGHVSKFSTLVKFFKPWKWRRKKKSDRFKETSKGIYLFYLDLLKQFNIH